MCACGLCALNFVIRISICRSNMRNHADMRIFMRSCVTEGNRNTRNRIQEITNFHSSYNSVDQRSSRFRNPSEFTSLILKAHRSFSSGVPEPVMSVANMNSCFREFMWRGSIPFLRYRYLISHPEVNAAILVFVKDPENLVDKHLRVNWFSWNNKNISLSAVVSAATMIISIIVFIIIWNLRKHHQQARWASRFELCEPSLRSNIIIQLFPGSKFSHILFCLVIKQ